MRSPILAIQHRFERLRVKRRITAGQICRRTSRQTIIQRISALLDDLARLYIEKNKTADRRRLIPARDALAIASHRDRRYRRSPGISQGGGATRQG